VSPRGPELRLRARVPVVDDPRDLAVNLTVIILEKPVDIESLPTRVARALGRGTAKNPRR